MNSDIENRIKQIGDEIISAIVSEILRLTDKAGLYCRVFARIKSEASISKKMAEKGYNNFKKMQDLVGVRIVFYFPEDIEIFKRYLKYNFKYLYDSESTTLSDIVKDEILVENIKDGLQDKLFMPTRLNLVFKADEKLKTQYDYLFELINTKNQTEPGYNIIATQLIDYTFEVQFRSVLSEGWHEVEHDLRYKCKDDWKNMPNESRMLNGIYASIETCEQSMNLLWTSMARKYRDQKNWAAMIRNTIKLRIEDKIISPEIKTQFSIDRVLPKITRWLNREQLIRALLDSPQKIELTLDNIILLANKLHKRKPNMNLLQYAKENKPLIDAVDRRIIQDVVRKDSRRDSSSKIINGMTVLLHTSEVGQHYIFVITESWKKIQPNDMIHAYKEYQEKGLVILDFSKLETITMPIAKNILVPLLLEASDGLGGVNVKGITFNEETRTNINKPLIKEQKKLYKQQLTKGKSTLALPNLEITKSAYGEWNVLTLTDIVYD